eukprot:1139462-Pelagomonas_calceolata.AAC.4
MCAKCAPLSCMRAYVQDKNKDFVVTEHQTLMASSSLSFVAQLFQEALDTGVLCFHSRDQGLCTALCGTAVPGGTGHRCVALSQQGPRMEEACALPSVKHSCFRR